MKVVEVAATEIEGRLEVPWRIATATMGSLNAVLVTVTADDGTTGYGEACARGGTSVTKAVVDDLLAPVLVGRDPFQIEATWEDMYATLRTRGHSRGFLIEAMSGVDIALWDLVGRSLDLPISRLMLGAGRTALPAYASSILLDEPAVMADEAGRLQAEGYRAIKVKISGDLADDVARIEAIRRRVGPSVRLMLDANSGFDPAGAISLAREAERLGIYWLEEPIFLDDLPGYRRIRRSVDMRIALGEGEFTPGGFRELVTGGLVDVLQPNVTRAGGVTGVRRIAALAQAFGLPVAPHTGASGPICMAATLQLAAALPNFLIHEFMYLENPFEAFFTTPLPRPARGVIEVPQGAGLGVEVHPESPARFSRPDRNAGGEATGERQREHVRSNQVPTRNRHGRGSSEGGKP